MRAFAGQAARLLAAGLHRLLQLALALVLLATVAVLALSWRLSRGPLELPWLAHRLEAAANTGPTRLAIGHLTLAWNGFSRGVDHPIDIELADLAITDAQGRPVASLARAALTLSPARLLLGQMVPRSLALAGLRAHAVRGPDGALRLDLGSLDETAADPSPDPSADPSPNPAALLQQLAAPPQTDSGSGTSRWTQLRSIRITDAALSIDDRQFGLVWELPAIAADLTRLPQGGLAGQADISGRLGDQPLHLALQASTAADGRSSTLRLQLSDLTPARLAVPKLAAIDLPIALAAEVRLDAGLRPTHLHADATFGFGSLALGRGRLPITSALLHADGTLDAMEIVLERLELAPRAGRPISTVQARATARREAGAIALDVALQVDALAFADLPDIWPDGLGGKGTKIWLARNITAGFADHAHAEMTLQLPEDFSDASLTSLAGGLEGHDLTVAWLAPVPPLEHGEARLTFQGPDVIEILIPTAHQAGRHGGLAVRGGRLRIAGLAARDQVMDIDADLSGPLADLLTLLKHPRLQLLDKHPVELRDPAGAMTGHLSLARLPLEDRVTIDDIRIAATARLTDVHLGGVAGGRDLDRGLLDVAVTNDGLTLSGQAEIARIPARLKVEMDFRSGPPSQVMQKISASASLGPAQLKTLGLDLGEAVGPMLAGAAAMQVELKTTRDQHGDVAVHADLTDLALRPPRLNWSKPSGRPAVADVHLRLDHDRLVAIDRLSVQGDGIDLRGEAIFAAGKPAGLRLARLALGQALDVHGELRWPTPGTPWTIALAGPLLDLTPEARTAPKPPAANAPGPDAPAPATADRPGTPYRIDAQLGRLLFGADRALTGVVLHAEDDGRILRSATLSGQAGTGPAGSPFSLAIAPQGPRARSLTGNAADLGALLRAANLFDNLRGGRLTLDGRFDDSTPRHALTGTAGIAGFSLLNAPGAAKLLQAMTLYGLVEAVQGPGLKLDQLVAPFNYSEQVITLGDARVFSASLGMTAKGRIDTARGTCDLEGTIVPAYFLNTMLGRIPLVGRLFSPETGGGLFAATYGLHGRCDDPGVRVNPLAVVTPGFLRGLFGLLDGPAATPLPSAPSAGSGRN